ncbi:hypothetical protein QFZ28_004012 [Neobacillus niacini]|uniref:LamG-like jellyroll fold domain-containing protein n=1 Tax=Neobacillus niacini TaxID=86668 RepID=UPI0027833E69|nr:LamG-like jellyroll fold domain-containing protein [Neobacillus niacini]MDQ1003612.1 hypothetical protein [Neobacillus niacini]
MEFKHGSLYFSGADLIQTKPLFKDINNTFTIEFWVKPEASQLMNRIQRTSGNGGTTGQRYVIGPGYGDDEENAGMGVSVGTNGIIVYEHSSNYLPPILVHPTPILNWTHIAIVYDDKTPSLYINGKLVKIGLKSNKKHVHPSGTLGGLEPYGFYVGYLKDVRIWNFAKSEEQIRKNLSKRLTGNEKGLYVYWKLTDGIQANFNQTDDKELKLANDPLVEKVSAPLVKEVNDNIVFCTSICSNYLPKAMVLARSIKKFHPDSKMVVCLVEETVPPAAKTFAYFDEIILAKNLGIADFYRFIFRHNALEASTAVKGSLFTYLLNTYKHHSKFIYLDPDIYVLDRLTELYSLLDHHSIIVTPHLLVPENKDNVVSIKGNEIQILRKGIFNLGFLAINREANSEQFISWWRDRLFQYCYDDTANGLFTDQKWVDLAPSFFDVFILKHPGYNVAPWNLSKRTIHLAETGQFLVNNQALKFVHFSGLDSGANLSVTKYYVPDPANPIYFIRSQYLQELNEMGQDSFKKIPWSYGHYRNNEKIQRKAQLNYRENPVLQRMYKNPFQYSNTHFLS